METLTTRFADTRNAGCARRSAVWVCCLGLSAQVLAAPPPSRTLSTDRLLDTSEGRTSEVPRNLWIAAPAASPRLDLRPPAATEFAALRAESVPLAAPAAQDQGSGRFLPFPAHRSPMSEEPHSSLATGEAGMPALRVGAADTLLQRFQHEGLPLAKLWESHSALVSLGLNQRGKPGLWLMQKTR